MTIMADIRDHPAYKSMRNDPLVDIWLRNDLTEPDTLEAAGVRLSEFILKQAYTLADSGIDYNDALRDLNFAGVHHCGRAVPHFVLKLHSPMNGAA